MFKVSLVSQFRVEFDAEEGWEGFQGDRRAVDAQVQLVCPFVVFAFTGCAEGGVYRFGFIY